MSFRESQFPDSTYCEEIRNTGGGWGPRSEPQGTNCSMATTETANSWYAVEKGAFPQYGTHPNHHSTCSQHYPSTCACHNDGHNYGYTSDNSHLWTGTPCTFTPPVVHCRSSSGNDQPTLHRPITRNCWRECAQRQQPNYYPNPNDEYVQCNCIMNGDPVNCQRQATIPDQCLTADHMGLSVSPMTAAQHHRSRYLTKTHTFLPTGIKPTPHHHLPLSSPKLYNKLVNTDERSDVGWQHPDFREPPHLVVGVKNTPVNGLKAGPVKNLKGGNVCQLCGKSYARPSTLKTHLRTHSGERPYKCSLCPKTFSQTANLTAHMRTHSGEKPFRCHICQREFSQSSSVTTHMRTHSGERPYRCGFCCKAFADSSTLTKHLRIHSGEKPYQCAVCFLRFSQSGNLTRHMKVHDIKDE